MTLNVFVEDTWPWYAYKYRIVDEIR